MKWLFMPMAALLFTTGCFKRTHWEQAEIPGNTFVLEFSQPIRYVFELTVDGKRVPIDYKSRNRVLIVSGLDEGVHHFNLHSISYVFGPEFDRFKVTAEAGAYAFIQSRKYRSAIPKERKQVSIRAYRKAAKKDEELVQAKVRASF
ncbi:MAG: hypothetical protein KDC35_01100 [Acidobacteria bacterium]|nr:hypothetical protein [Acidobacteriota bacterium]